MTFYYSALVSTRLLLWFLLNIGVILWKSSNFSQNFARNARKKFVWVNIFKMVGHTVTFPWVIMVIRAVCLSDGHGPSILTKWWWGILTSPPPLPMYAYSPSIMELKEGLFWILISKKGLFGAFGVKNYWLKTSICNILLALRYWPLTLTQSQLRNNRPNLIM